MARFRCFRLFQFEGVCRRAGGGRCPAGAHAKAQGWIYSGYKMTIFSTAEEQQREPLEIGGKVLFYPDFALRTAGGDVSVVRAFGAGFVVQDRELK